MFIMISEVDYAHSLRKTIIPLIIDMDFMPDGWLNQHIHKEKTFDFSRRSMFNGSLDALVEYLKILSAQKGDIGTINININESGIRFLFELFFAVHACVVRACVRVRACVHGCVRCACVCACVHVCMCVCWCWC